MWNETDSAAFLDFGAAFVPDRDSQMEIICGLLPDPKLAYDGSKLMRERARPRFEVRIFDLADTAWRTFAEKPDAVVSSLAIHHLDDAGKRALYADMFRQIAPGGALVVADLIAPASDAAREIAAMQWDLAIDAQHRAAFERERWNLYRYPDPATDKPGKLLDQLTWLRDIGYEGVDAVYLRAGHAIFTGRIPC
jgi:tRNA (cmo5U34)-methyltransferase